MKKPRVFKKNVLFKTNFYSLLNDFTGLIKAAEIDW